MTPCVIHRLEPIDVTEQQTDGGRLLKRSHDGSQLLLGFFTGILGLALASPLAAVIMVLTQELYIKDALGGGDSQAD